MADEEGGAAPEAPTGGQSEAVLKMELQRKKQQEKEEEEMKEFQAQRAEEREKEANEIQQLKERREQRKRERIEEEKRLAEQRAAEDQKKKTDENFNPRDVYVRHRVEEASKEKWMDECGKQLDWLRKLQEASGKGNFTVQPSGGTPSSQNEDGGIVRPSKSKEELEKEKEDTLKQRTQSVNLDGLSQQQLEEKAKEIWQWLYRLESEKYDLEQRNKRQRDDLTELAERARQISKGGAKKAATPRQEPTADDQSSEKYSGAPPKVTMYSPYERVKDRRSFGERREVFKGLTILEEVVPGSAPTGFAPGGAAPAAGGEAPAADAPPAN